MAKLPGKWQWLMASSIVLVIFIFLYIKFSEQGEGGERVTWVG